MTANTNTSNTAPAEPITVTTATPTIDATDTTDATDATDATDHACESCGHRPKLPWTEYAAARAMLWSADGDHHYRPGAVQGALRRRLCRRCAARWLRMHRLVGFKRRTALPVGGRPGFPDTLGRPAAQGRPHVRRATRPLPPKPGGNGGGADGPGSYYPGGGDTDTIARLSDSPSDGQAPAGSEESYV